jgi:hypothetical protein
MAAIEAFKIDLTTKMTFASKPSWWGFSWKEDPFANITTFINSMSRFRFDPVPDSVKDFRQAVKLLKEETSHHPIEYELLHSPAPTWTVRIDHDVIDVYRKIKSFFTAIPARTLRARFQDIVDSYRSNTTLVVVYACDTDCSRAPNMTKIVALAGPSVNVSGLPVINLAAELKRKTLDDSWDVAFPAVYLVSNNTKVQTQKLAGSGRV